jgi:glycogen debranching enzyme
MEQIFRREPDAPLTQKDIQSLRETEWLVTNGLGGYASGTIGGVLTRVFHGYLIAALPSPLGRTMMLNDLLEELVFPDGDRIALNGLETTNSGIWESGRCLTRFHLDGGLPVWTYELKNITLEKRVYLPNRQNTTFINYQISAGEGNFQIRLRPAVNMRGHEAPVNSAIGSYKVSISDHSYEIQSEQDLPPLRLKLIGEEGGFVVEPRLSDSTDRSEPQCCDYRVHRGRRTGFCAFADAGVGRGA